MPLRTNVSTADVKPGDEIYGYRVLRAGNLPAIHADFFELRHRPTGARHIHIRRPDRENTFGVILKTVPWDSTGVAHILEHVVLCGSERFPVRDPFFSMLKRSLNTFMNAFTSSDWTMYPYATQNRKDFYNLMEVYLDAVFSPRLEELSFKQEGHRLELEPGQEGPERLVYKGVVYNEMKGAMSSPDQVMARSMLKALYPDTTYSNNSGGEPSDIPSLSYSQLKDFHRRHYHPSNAYFFTYGDLSLPEHLAVISKSILDGFDAIDPATDVPVQPRWGAPRVARFPYPFARNEDPTRKHQTCVAWLTSDIRETGDILSLALLEQILLGNAGSPLRKALIDSGLGSALSDGSGFDAEPRDTRYAAGLKDVEADAEEKIEGIILDTLARLSEGGIDPEWVESAIHQLEFHRREITNTPYPYGIQLLLGIGGTWIHGGDPLRVLKFDDDLAEIRRQIERGRFFERQIERFFLTNPHRVRLTLYPDQEMAEREEHRVEAKLAEIRQALTPAEEEQLRRDAQALRLLQEAKESVNCLPTLERQDIPPEVERVAASRADSERSVTYFEQPTSGIVYAAAAAGSGGIDPGLSPLVPFFCHAFSRIGTARRDYSEMARWIDAVTGGVALSANPRTGFDGAGECIPFVALTAKCLLRNLAPMFDLLAELLVSYDFSDTDRLKNLLLEYRSGLESMVIHNGHRLAMSLAARRFSAARALSEEWNGVHQLLAIKSLSEGQTEERLERLSTDMSRLGRLVLNHANFKLAVIGEAEAVQAAGSPAGGLAAGLPAGAGAVFSMPPLPPSAARIREGWAAAAAVNFVAAAFPVARMEHEDAAVLAVIAKLLRSLYLHREIREKGGAYGGFAVYNSEDGTFSLASYRDPHIVETLDVFQGAAGFICSGGFDETDVKEAVLQVCSEIDKPDPPGPAARKAFFRGIIGLSDQLRQGFKQRLIALTRGEVLAAAGRYFGGGLEHCSVAVIGSEENLRAANARLQEPLDLHTI